MNGGLKSNKKYFHTFFIFYTMHCALEYNQVHYQVYINRLSIKTHTFSFGNSVALFVLINFFFSIISKNYCITSDVF